MRTGLQVIDENKSSLGGASNYGKKAGVKTTISVSGMPVGGGSQTNLHG